MQATRKLLGLLEVVPTTLTQLSRHTDKTHKHTHTHTGPIALTRPLK